jgi:hypothetical protein
MRPLLWIYRRVQPFLCDGCHNLAENSGNSSGRVRSDVKYAAPTADWCDSVIEVRAGHGQLLN